MDDFSRITIGIDNTDNQQFRRGGNSKFLGNSWLFSPSMLLSFQGARGRGYPYILPVINSSLVQETGEIARGVKSYIFPDKSQYVDPTKRQTQNLDTSKPVTTKQSIGASISMPLVIGLAVVAAAVLTMSLHFSGVIDLGGGK